MFGGKVLSVDESSIQDLPGVRKVISLGNAVAVVADGYWQARQALLQLKIEFSDNGNGHDQSGIFEKFARDMDRTASTHSEKIDFLSGNASRALTRWRLRPSVAVRLCGTSGAYCGPGTLPGEADLVT